MNIMKVRFEEYLIKQGYKLKTPSGNPSTAYDYVKRIDRVCDWEGLTWEGAANIIGQLICQYDIGGEKEELGNKSHRAVINALKRYQEFIGTL